MQLGRSARLRHLAGRRALFGHHGNIDWGLTRAAWPELTHEQRNDLVCVQSGGLPHPQSRWLRR